MVIIKKVYFFIVFCLLLGLTGCIQDTEINSLDVFNQFDFSPTKYISLSDYKNIHVSKEYVTVTNSDIETTIDMDLSYYEKYKKTNLTSVKDDSVVLLKFDNQSDGESFNSYYCIDSNEYGETFDKVIRKMKIGDINNIDIDDVKYNIELLGIYEYATYKDTDIVLDYYKKDSISEVYSYLTERVQKEIIYNYMLDNISENSTIISYPNFIKNQLSDDNLSFWKNILIFKAILYQENISFSYEDFTKLVNESAEENNVSEKYILENYSANIYYSGLLELVKNTLPQYIIIDE